MSGSITVKLEHGGTQRFKDLKELEDWCDKELDSYAEFKGNGYAQNFCFQPIERIKSLIKSEVVQVSRTR